MLPMRIFGAACAAALLGTAAPALAQDAYAPARDSSGFWSWFYGEWSLTLGGAGFVGPKFEGSKDMRIGGMPIISLGRKGSETRFSSRNDSAGFGLIDTGFFRAGPVGALIMPRDADDELRGLRDIKFGVELGGFAEIYPTDWLRVRGEVRHGVGSHHGVVADLAVDAFTDITPTVRLSAGPRLSAATESYFETYYGVTVPASVTSGLAPYSPEGGIRSYGFGGAATWQVTDKVTTQLFGEYSRLGAPAADSSLVKQRGSRDQFLIGVSATYRFDFTL